MPVISLQVDLYDGGGYMNKLPQDISYELAEQMAQDKRDGWINPYRCDDSCVL